MQPQACAYILMTRHFCVLKREAVLLLSVGDNSARGYNDY